LVRILHCHGHFPHLFDKTHDPFALAAVKGQAR